MADDLTRPLGLEPERKKRRPLPYVAVAGAIGAVVLGGAGVWFATSARTTVVADISLGDKTGSIAKPLKASPPRHTATAGPGLTEVDAPQGGVLPLDKGKVTITDPSKQPPIQLASLPRSDLVEKTRYGPLPRVAEDGTRPLDAYARPAPPASGLNRIAIVVGGIGIADGATAVSLDSLPGEVTLAFAPYGDDLPAALAKARATGHEILLQVPLEPYNFPDISPGPHTLTTKASRTQNLDDLHWLLGRITTYVGVVNYMGARFSGSVDAMSPVLAEIGKRGLLYLDDGSSPQSRAAELAGGQVPFLQADVVLDADTAPDAIDARLEQLAAIARQRGYAIGTGSAFPSTVARIDAFATDAEKHGIVLVPVTALLAAGRT